MKKGYINYNRNRVVCLNSEYGEYMVKCLKPRGNIFKTFFLPNISLLEDYWEPTWIEQNQILLLFLLLVFIYFYTNISFFVMIRDHSDGLIQLQLWYYLYLTWVLLQPFLLLNNQFSLKSKIFPAVITIRHCLPK